MGFAQARIGNLARCFADASRALGLGTAALMVLLMLKGIRLYGRFSLDNINASQFGCSRGQSEVTLIEKGALV